MIITERPPRWVFRAALNCYDLAGVGPLKNLVTQLLPVLTKMLEEFETEDDEFSSRLQFHSSGPDTRKIAGWR